MAKPFWLHALFPTHCPFCGEAILRTEECCDDCLEKLPNYYSRGFRRVLRPGVGDVQSVYYYKEGVRHAVFLMKFRSDRDTGRLLGQALARMVHSRYRHIAFDLILPVPISKWRRFTRGYNQSEWLGEEVSRHLGVSMETGLLEKIRHTPDQHKQEEEERQENLLGAFRVSDASRLAGKTILLIDDVYTSGWTTGLCAKTLLEAGAQSVYVAVVAMAQATEPNL